MATNPSLSNQSTEADINSANQWMWQQPWYQQAIQSFGQQMGNVRLNDRQKAQLAQVIAQHGFPLPDKDEIDPSGNVNPKGHKMRNFLIAAAIGGATIATLGAAGAFAGAAGTGAAGAGGAAGATGAAGAGTAAGIALPTSTIGLAGSGFGTAALGAGAAGATTAAGLSTAAGLGDTIAGTSAANIVGGLAPSASHGLGSLGWANLIGAGAQLGGAAIQSRATGHAADTQAQSEREALDFLKQRDARDYADQAPYRNIGAGAVGIANRALGLSPTPAPSQGMSLGASLNGARPAGPPTGTAMPRGGDPNQFVTMFDSSGAGKQVPSSDVMRLLSMGATLQPQTGAV